MSKKINEVIPTPAPVEAPELPPVDAEALAKDALATIACGLTPTLTAGKKSLTFAGLVKPHDAFAAAVEKLVEHGFSYLDLLRYVVLLLQAVREVGGPNIVDIVEKFKKLLRDFRGE